MWFMILRLLAHWAADIYRTTRKMIKSSVTFLYLRLAHGLAENTNMSIMRGQCVSWALIGALNDIETQKIYIVVR